MIEWGGGNDELVFLYADAMMWQYRVLGYLGYFLDKEKKYVGVLKIWSRIEAFVCLQSAGAIKHSWEKEEMISPRPLFSSSISSGIAEVCSNADKLEPP